MRSLHLCLGLSLCLISLATVADATPARAQDLTDVARPKDEGLKLDLLGSAELRSGNVNLTSLSEQFWGRYRQKQHYVSLLGTHAFAIQGGERFMNAARALAQYRYNVMPKLLGGLGPEVILHYDRDEFRRREHLLNAGLGPYIQVLDSEKLRWNVTVAYVFEFEKFAKLTSEDNPSKVVRDSEFELNSHRAWFGSEFGWEIAKRFHVGEALIIQVPLDHCPCDTRVYTTTYLRIYGNDYVGLQTGLSVLYDSRPGINVKSFDAIARSSLVFSL